MVVAMSFYRNRYLLAGLLLLLLGIQFRMVHSFVLNEPATRALAKFGEQASVSQQSTMTNFLLNVVPNPTKTVTPPRWFGLSMITVGAVIICHGIVIPRSAQ